MIITHVSPDMDAIGSVWLLQRYGGMQDHEITFVNTGQPNVDLLASADAVCDTGRVFNPRSLCFDHHHLPGQAANETCATLQVYQWLIMHEPSIDWNYLSPIVELILAGDTGQRGYGADVSRKVGIHAMLSALKARRASDQELMDAGQSWLNLLADHSAAHERARAMLADCIVYTSDDGLVVAIENGSQAATFAAIEAGARLVIFHSEYPDIPTIAVGCSRGGEWQKPHIGDLVRSLLAQDIDSALLDELSMWFLYPAGFMAGRGTPKAPNPAPLNAAIRDIARAIDRAWQR